MPAKLLFTIIGFNSLVVIFLAGVVVIYFRPNQFGMMTSLFLGWLTGFINLGTSEPQFPVLLLLAFGFFLGFTTPKSVWKQAIVLGLFVPLSQFIWIEVTHQNELFFSDGVGSLISFLPAFGGVYLGKFIAGVHRAKLGSVNGLIAGESHT
jgi:apolipoprotein N-acyltransferase